MKKVRFEWIAEDLNHSQKEKRYYCFGKVGDGIITVRFTYRGSVDFFKNEAKKNNTQYQKMIRRLLDLYAAHHRQPPQTG